MVGRSRLAHFCGLLIFLISLNLHLPEALHLPGYTPIISEVAPYPVIALSVAIGNFQYLLSSSRDESTS